MGKKTMLKLPTCGFAKRVDDTVARAMTILKNREDYTTKATPSPLPKPAQKPHRWSLNY
jgi:hypothetical protein